MRNIKLLFAVALLATSAQSSGAEPKQIDIAHELEATAFTLPAVSPGTLVVQACRACPTFRFETTQNTLYRVGPETVSLAQIKAEFAARPDSLVLLELTADRRAVVQIAMSAPATN